MNKQRLISSFKPMVPGRHGSAPMSNWMARFLLTLQILGGPILTVVDYKSLLDTPLGRFRNPAVTWRYGLGLTLLLNLLIGLIVSLDRRGITKAALVPLRRKEKRVIFGISVGVTVLMLILTLVYGIS